MANIFSSRRGGTVYIPPRRDGTAFVFLPQRGGTVSIFISAERDDGKYIFLLSRCKVGAVVCEGFPALTFYEYSIEVHPDIPEAPLEPQSRVWGQTT